MSEWTSVITFTRIPVQTTEAKEGAFVIFGNLARFPPFSKINDHLDSGNAQRTVDWMSELGQRAIVQTISI